MRDISDKEIDNLFRELSEKQDVPFEENSWARMEAKMDRADRRRLIGRWIKLGGCFFGALFIGALFINRDQLLERGFLTEDKELHFHNNKSPELSFTPFRKEEREIKADENARLNADRHTEAGKPYTQLKQENQVAVNKTGIEPSVQRTENFKNSVFGNKQGKLNKRTGKTAKGENVSHSERGIGKDRELTHAVVGIPEDSVQGDRGMEQRKARVFQVAHIQSKVMLQDGNADHLYHPDMKEGNKVVAEQTSLSLPQGSDHDNTKEIATDNSGGEIFVKGSNGVSDSIQKKEGDSLVVIQPSDSSKTSARKHKEKRKSDPNRWLSIGAMVAPDFSSVGFFRLARPGVAEGISVEYHLSPRWGIFLGLIKSQKLYSTPYQESYSNKKYVQPERIDGKCGVLEIPLQLKYYIKSQGRNLFFISGGVSSYVLLTEQYTYVYDNYIPPKTQEWSNKNQNIFSILHFSAGYERMLSDRFSVAAEPFLKIPVQDVGEKKVDLITSGAFFHFRYNIRKH